MAFPTNIDEAWRRFVRAACWSLVLHGLLLWPAVLLLPTGQATGKHGDARGRVDIRIAAGAVPPLQAGQRAPVQAKPLPQGALTQAAPPPGRRKGVTPSPAASSEMDGAGLDADDLRTYRIALAVSARPHWRYPSVAFQRGEGGTVEVRVSVTGSGGATASLERSSGHRLLDEAAVEMLREALATAEAPQGLRGKPFSLLIPVEFSPEGNR